MSFLWREGCWKTYSVMEDLDEKLWTPVTLKLHYSESPPPRLLSFAGSNILHLPVCGVWSSDGKWALHLKQWMGSFRASVLNCKRDGNKLPPKCPFISLWAYSQFSMKNALSDVPFWFRYVFLMVFLFLLPPWFAFSQFLFMKIFWSFLSVTAYLWSLFSSVWLVLHFLGGVRSNADFLLHLI